MRTAHDPRKARLRLAREAGAYLAHTALFPFGYLKHGHEPERAPDIRTVVFVHGLAANRAGFLPLQTWLKCKGVSRHYAVNYRSAGASIEGLAAQLDQHLRRDVRGGRIDLVAHSMGGLVARAWLQMMGGDRRVGTLITLGTPHGGSHATAWMPTRLVSQLQPGGPFLSYLDSLPPPQRVHCVSVAAEDDMLVLPSTNALWSHGEQILMPDMGHLDMLLSPRVFRLVRDVLGPDPARTHAPRSLVVPASRDATASRTSPSSQADSNALVTG